MRPMAGTSVMPLMTDPRVFLSAIATTTGALVAIVGGLLVSRLVALSAEQRGLQRRINQLNANLESLATEYAALDDQRRARCKRWFEDAHLEDLVLAKGVMTDEQLMEWLPLGIRDEEASDMARALRDAISRAFTVIGRAFPQPALPPTSVTALRASTVDVPQADVDVYEAVARAIEEERRPRTPLHSLAGTSLISLGVPGAAVDRTVDRQERTLESLRQLDHDRHSLEATLALLQSDSTRLGRPRFLWVAAGALGYFALGGAAFPLSLLAFDPLDNRVGLRQIVFFVFLSGLLALLGYIALAIRDLRRSITSEPRATPGRSSAEEARDGTPHSGGADGSAKRSCGEQLVRNLLSDDRRRLTVRLFLFLTLVIAAGLALAIDRVANTVSTLDLVTLCVGATVFVLPLALAFRQPAAPGTNRWRIALAVILVMIAGFLFAVGWGAYLLVNQDDLALGQAYDTAILIAALPTLLILQDAVKAIHNSDS